MLLEELVNEGESEYRDSLTIKPQVVINDAHHSSAPSFPSFARETSSCSRAFAPDAFGKPSYEKAEARPAHADGVFFASEPLGLLVTLNMSGKQKRLKVVEVRVVYRHQRRGKGIIESDGLSNEP